MITDFWFSIAKLPWAYPECYDLCLISCDDSTLLAIPSVESKVFQCYMLDFYQLFTEKDNNKIGITHADIA